MTMRMEQQLTLFPEPSRRHWAQQQRRSTGARRQEGPRHPGDGRGRHDHSLAAHAGIEHALTGRRAEIVAWLRDHGPATDRQIVAGLYYDGADMNLVRPRVSELLDAAALVEVDRMTDAVTGMMVRRVDVSGRAGRPGAPQNMNNETESTRKS